MMEPSQGSQKAHLACEEPKEIESITKSILEAFSVGPSLCTHCMLTTMTGRDSLQESSTIGVQSAS